jgi:hypothetical protein
MAKSFITLAADFRSDSWPVCDQLSYFRLFPESLRYFQRAGSRQK